MLPIARLVLLACASLLAAATSAGADSGPFDGIVGAWKGSGRITLEGGKSETIRCNAYYTEKDKSLGLAIRCASQSYKIELRSLLTSNGNHVTGSWEERTFNAVGDVTGRAKAGNIQLTISGGGLSGSMSVATSGSVQTVSINTQGTALQGVSIKLSRG